MFSKNITSILAGRAKQRMKAPVLEARLAALLSLDAHVVAKRLKKHAKAGVIELDGHWVKLVQV